MSAGGRGAAFVVHERLEYLEKQVIDKQVSADMEISEVPMHIAEPPDPKYDCQLAPEAAEMQDELIQKKEKQNKNKKSDERSCHLTLSESQVTCVE